MTTTMLERMLIQIPTSTALLLANAKTDGRLILSSTEFLEHLATLDNMPAAPYVVIHLLTDILIRMKNVIVLSVMYKIVHLLASVSKGMK